MAFTYRLSRRLAQIHLSLLLALSLACSDQGPGLAASQADDAESIVAQDAARPAVSYVTTALTNEPAGFTPISTRYFDARVESGWRDRGGNNFSIFQNSTAPKSPIRVGKATYPVGFKGGTAPLNTWYALSPTRKNVYVSFWVRLSPNWVGHPSAMNKIMHFWIGGSNRVVFKAMGVGSKALMSTFHLQGVNNIPSSINLTSNLSGKGEMIRGRWHQVEIVVRANTGNNKDGEVTWWVDGIKIGDHKNLGFVTDPMGHVFTQVSWSPTWGGIGGVVPAVQDMQVDHIYISGQ